MCAACIALIFQMVDNSERQNVRVADNSERENVQVVDNLEWQNVRVVDNLEQYNVWLTLQGHQRNQSGSDILESGSDIIALPNACLMIYSRQQNYSHVFILCKDALIPAQGKIGKKLKLL